MCSSTRIPPRFADRKAGRFGQRRVGPHADRKDYDFSSVGLA